MMIGTISANEKTITFQGVSFGRGSTIDIVKMNQCTLVAKVPRHTIWTGNYQRRRYKPSMFYVFKIDASDKQNADGSRDVVAEILISFQTQFSRVQKEVENQR